MPNLTFSKTVAPQAAIYLTLWMLLFVFTGLTVLLYYKDFLRLDPSCDRSEPRLSYEEFVLLPVALVALCVPIVWSVVLTGLRAFAREHRRASCHCVAVTWAATLSLVILISCT